MEPIEIFRPARGFGVFAIDGDNQPLGLKTKNTSVSKNPMLGVCGMQYSFAWSDIVPPLLQKLLKLLKLQVWRPLVQKHSGRARSSHSLVERVTPTSR